MRERTIPAILAFLAVGVTLSCGWVLHAEPNTPPLTGIQPVSLPDAEERPWLNQEDARQAQPATLSSVSAPAAIGCDGGATLDSLRRHLRQLAEGELRDAEELELNSTIARELRELSKSRNLSRASVDALMAISEPTIVREAGTVLLAAVAGQEALGQLAALASDSSENPAVRLRALVSGTRLLRAAQGPAADVFRCALEKVSASEQRGLVADLARDALAGRL